jgi:DNA-binding NtrC family response regulator
MLAEKFLEDFVRSYPRPIAKPRLSEPARQALVAEQFPGNVRQLKNIIQRAAHLCRDGVIEPSDLHLGRREQPMSPSSDAAPVAGGIDPALFDTPFKEAKQHMVDSFERAYFGKLLEKTDGNLSRASAEAGITRYYLRELLKRLGMHKSQTDANA